MLNLTIKKISANDYEIVEEQPDRTKVVNLLSLQDEILELKEKKTRIENELLKKEELLKQILKIK